MKHLACVIISHAHLDHCGALPYLSTYNRLVNMTIPAKAIWSIVVMLPSRVCEDLIKSIEAISEPADISHKMDERNDGETVINTRLLLDNEVVFPKLCSLKQESFICYQTLTVLNVKMLKIAADRANLDVEGNDLLSWTNHSFDGAGLEPDSVSPVPGYIIDILLTIKEAKENIGNPCRLPLKVKKNLPDKTQFSVERFTKKYGKYMPMSTLHKLVMLATPRNLKQEWANNSEISLQLASPSHRGSLIFHKTSN